jgi:hypothetical protein
MGFVHCTHEGLAEEFGLEYDARNIRWMKPPTNRENICG